MRKVLRAAIAGVMVAGVALLPANASATPSRGVTGKILAQTTAGGKDYVLREITLQPEGSTGWHFHKGTLYAFVKQGTLTRTMSDCTTNEVHPAGTGLIEPSGADHVHIGRNLGKTPIVLEVLYVNPAGSALSEDAPNPGCDFE